MVTNAWVNEANERVAMSMKINEIFLARSNDIFFILLLRKLSFYESFKFYVSEGEQK